MENPQAPRRLSTLQDSASVYSTEALDLGDELCRPILEAIPHVVWTASPDGSTTYLNRRGTELIGVNPEQLAGWNWLQQLHPEDVDRSRQCWQSAIDTGTEYANEYRVRHADGRYRWYLAQAVPLRGRDGRASGWMGTWTNIDRRRAEERHERDAQLLANVRDWIIVTDAAHRDVLERGRDEHVRLDRRGKVQSP